MQARHVVSGLTLTAFVFLCACHTDQVTGVAPITNATVHFVNATTTSMDITTNGTVEDGNGSIAFGNSGVCTVVNATNPSLAVNQAGTATAIGGFMPSFVAGGNYTVVAYPGASGTTQFATLTNTGFSPDSATAGFSIFNAASGASSVDAYVGSNSTASASGITFGNGSVLFGVPTGKQTVMIDNAGTTTPLITAPNQTFAGGTSSMLVVAPPAAGSTALQYFVIPAC